MINDAICFKRLGEGVIKISVEVLNIFKQYKQDEHQKLEAGGVLIGRHILYGKDIVIDRVTEPLDNDKQTRYSFYRGQENHQKIVSDQWVKSGGRSTYLGEWHTHPESYPSPSKIDLKDWKKQIRKTQFYGTSLFFIIIGIDTFRIWEIRKGSKAIPMELFERTIQQ